MNGKDVINYELELATKSKTSESEELVTTLIGAPKKSSLKTNTSGIFSVLSEELCLYILHNMDLCTSRRMAQTCRFWCRLANDDLLFKFDARRRFSLDIKLHQVRLNHESEEKDWRNFYIRLDAAQTSWKGFAMDRATNVFKPYPMELVISQSSLNRRNLDNLEPHREKSFGGFCRWSSLRDSLTKVLISII